ncbi:MAG: hypothetical protein BWY31_03801 [Lentisphaerae bacterium ADurb.Bin242]|nr:MAG: hypothetical protein BWY31_03801 [Lentisphaerae bacterium ADurb.Bin242]
MPPLKKILLVQYGHETNTFNPFPTTLERFGGKEKILTGNPLCDLESTLPVYREVLARPDILPVETVNAWANPWGRVSRETHEYVKEILRRKIRENGKIDGVLLTLHGAMVLEDDDDGEGDVLEFIRREAGPGVPVFAVLDLHANVTEKMLRNASVLIHFDTYPHIDIMDRVRESARLMLDTLDGKIHPVMAARKLPLLSEFLPTTEGIAKKFQTLALEYEKEPGVLTVSLAYGFFCADIRESGMCVVAVTDSDREKARKIADEFGRTVWAGRDLLQRSFSMIDEVLDDLKAHPENKPCVIADCCDNPGGGATGESTHILRALLKHGFEDSILAFMHGPELVEQAAKAGTGAEIDAAVGGKISPETDGEPFRCKARVTALTGELPRQGKVAALQVGKMHILVQSGNGQTWTPEGICACGLDVGKSGITVVKSTVHFRHAFEPLVRKIYSVAGPGMAPQKIRDVKLTRTRRPVYPLDDITDADAAGNNGALLFSPYSDTGG